MPVPARRLDLVLVPEDPDRLPEVEARALFEALVQRQVIEAGGSAGPEARWWCAGGFKRLWLDIPGHLALWANQGGGFRVTCPACGANVVPGFNAALSALRSGGPRRMTCGSCGADHPLEDLNYLPAAAFGRLAIVTADVGEAALTVQARALVERRLGPVRTVLRRP